MHDKLTELAFKMGSELAKSIPLAPEYGWPLLWRRDNTGVFSSIMRQDVLKARGSACWLTTWTWILGAWDLGHYYDYKANGIALKLDFHLLHSCHLSVNREEVWMYTRQYFPNLAVHTNHWLHEIVWGGGLANCIILKWFKWVWSRGICGTAMLFNFHVYMNQWGSCQIGIVRCCTLDSSLVTPMHVAQGLHFA